MATDQPLNWLDNDQASGDGRPRYVICGEEDGTWSVYDALTDLPVVWEHRMMVKMSFEQADDMVEMMNQIAGAPQARP